MHNNRIKLTIALQTHNRADQGYLQHMLDSILTQTYDDFELLIMDNHSTDSTLKLISEYKDSRLTYVRQPPGGNATTNTNRAVWMSRGEYILMTHDDDILEPNMVAEQMSYFQRYPETICVASNVSLMDHEGRFLQNRLYDEETDRQFMLGEYISSYLREKFWFPTPTMMYRRKAYMATQPNNVRMISPPYFPSGDIWSLFMFNLKGPVAFLAKPLLRYRQHPGQESRLVHQSEPMLQLMDMLLHRKKQHPVIKPMLPMIQALRAKYRLQDMIFKMGDQPMTNALSTRLAVHVKRSVARVRSHQGYPQEFLSVMIASKLMGVDLDAPDVIADPNGEGRSVQAYHSWYQRLSRGSFLFSSFSKDTSIAIFGSMLTAALMVLDARKCGIKGIRIYDSSPARIGSAVFGIQVQALDVLADRKTEEPVLLSSERDHEAAIKQILLPYVSRGAHQIKSWKDLALEEGVASE